MKEYKNKDIVVYWHPEKCAHPAVCIHTLPGVFCKDRRPWIDVNAAAPEDIIKCIDQCPSGALCYSLPEGSGVDPALGRGPGAMDAPKEKAVVRIKASKNCPYLIDGPVEIVDENGTPVYSGGRTALCSCGRTGNPPFCDGTHRK